MKRAQYKKSTANTNVTPVVDSTLLSKEQQNKYTLFVLGPHTRKNLTPIKLLARHLLPPAKDSNLLIER